MDTPACGGADGWEEEEDRDEAFQEGIPDVAAGAVVDGGGNVTIIGVFSSLFVVLPQVVPKPPKAEPVPPNITKRAESRGVGCVGVQKKEGKESTII